MTAPEDSRPCPFCAETIKAAAVRCRFCQADVEALVQQASRAEVDHNEERTERIAFWFKVGLAGMAVLVAVIGIVKAATYERPVVQDPGPKAQPLGIPPAHPETQSVARPEDPHTARAKKLHASLTLKQALEHIVFEGKQVGDAGLGELIVWGDDRLVWAEVSGPNQTTYAKVMKDLAKERGKTACFRGSIIEIRAQDVLGKHVYEGRMFSAGLADVVTFVAKSSTGDLVQQSSARFCGVVTGVYSYENSGGGTTHSISMYGMFDLPENK